MNEPYVERKQAVRHKIVMTNTFDYIRIPLKAGYVLTVERVWCNYFTTVEELGGDVELAVLQSDVYAPVELLGNETLWYKCKPYQDAAGGTYVTTTGAAPVVRHSQYYNTNDELNITVEGGTHVVVAFFSIFTNPVIAIYGVTYRYEKRDAWGKTHG